MGKGEYSPWRPCCGTADMVEDIDIRTVIDAHFEVKSKQVRIRATETVLLGVIMNYLSNKTFRISINYSSSVYKGFIQRGQLNNITGPPLEFKIMELQYQR
jgi:hypothetical protein